MLRINKLSLHRLSEIAVSLPGETIESHTYQSGETLFEEGTYAKGLFYVESGTILLSTSLETGSDVVISVIGSNNFIGYLPLIQKTRLTSTAITLVDHCRIKFIPKTLFLEALTDLNFLNGFMKILSERIRSNEKQALHLKTKNVRTKLATVLISLNDVFKKSANDLLPVITLKKKDLASFIGAAPETLSRQLADFEKRGLIELHFKGIKVKDLEKLLPIGEGVS